MSRAAPRRRADSERRRLPWRGAAVAGWCAVVVAATVVLALALAGVVTGRASEAAAVALATSYAVGLAARTGGRPLVFGLLTLVLGGVVLVADTDALRSGAAVVTAVVASVFAVMVTVPAVRFATAVREIVVALLVAAAGALATLAWDPVVDLDRFEYVSLALSLVAAFVTVFRLGAGFHGLGSRGIGTVVAGGLVLAGTLGYAELLRRYGTPGLVSGLDDAVRWSHHHLGAFPRPLVALLGVPALTWGTHMRARRRQGWWVCAFGVAATCPATYALLDPGRTVREVALATAYGAVIGLLLGWLLIRADLALTAPRLRGRGRRVQELEPVAETVRPEPGRTHALW